jgi:hypothetical protein
MSDANGQRGTDGNTPELPGVPVSSYEVVSSAAKTNDADLYSFRAEIPPPPPPPPPTPTQVVLEQNRTLLMALAGGGALVLLMVLVAWLVLRKDEPPAYVDLGTSNIAAAGLEGRLVARWLGSANYELRIDPASPPQLDGFSAVAGNPPHPLSINIQLKDSSGIVCQKQILIPFGGQTADPDNPAITLPQKTFDGDTVQNVVATSGKIDEIVINGPLNCPAKVYARLDAWDFSSNFPLIADQGDWQRHLENVAADQRHRTAEARARALIPKSAPLSAPIEGDDVIVSDNPSHGSIQTSTGRTFYIGRDVMLRSGTGWQIFPLSIHFRCDTKSNCTLTRPGSSAVLEARLVR